ncbi:hypothetical protein [Lentzea jiangxiensis]|uniref:Uncharacterized protein n=1 Tax=Lentzea jiangxiensis TaxID=641025 RepID=A0A1H0DJ70_9PSEU|nr:hypothetical protein [Lentzea jiangxiensis]SDN70174.1 hypothetical protein SAMN05421507_1015 [Lentzea jiangxiensis]
MAKIDGVVLVVDRARGSQPYAVTVDLPRVYRQISATEMEGLPHWEQRLVFDLLEHGELQRSSQVMSLRCGEYTRKVVRIEAPRRTDVQVKPGTQTHVKGSQKYVR